MVGAPASEQNTNTDTNNFSGCRGTTADRRGQKCTAISIRSELGKDGCGYPRTTTEDHLVPRRGLEPPRLSPLVPETSASTNSATWAAVREIRAAISACQRRPGASATPKRIPFHLDRDSPAWSASRRNLCGEPVFTFAGEYTRRRERAAGRISAWGERLFAPIQRWSDLVCRLRRANSCAVRPFPAR